MDLHTQRLAGNGGWDFIKIAALLCFVMASGIMISALSGLSA